MYSRSLAGATTAGAAVGLFCLCLGAQGQELIQNGGFEAGSLTGWTTVQQAGSSGGFFARPDGTQSDPYRSTVGPASGSYYAVSDQTGDGSHALLQSFTVAAPAKSVVLSFDMFVDNYNGPAVTPAAWTTPQAPTSRPA